jgi:tripartite-type tricarboxylate transporter receptor subunit TctC
MSDVEERDSVKQFPKHFGLDVQELFSERREQMKASRIAWVGSMVLVLAGFTFLSFSTTAQSAESGFFRMIVPHAPGSGADGHARLMSDSLAKVLGKPVVIENMPGAGGIKGVTEISRAPKDGYTFGLTNSNIVIIPSLYKKMPYDLLKDLTPISITATDSFVLTVNPGVPARSVKELIALAKSQPGKLNYATAGNGTVPHLVAEMFCSEAGVTITHVPYKGGSQIITDVIGGHVEMTFLTVGQSAQLVKTGKLRALGVSSLQRSSALPDLPTLAESGLPNFNYIGWITIVGPANLPQPLVKKLNGALMEVLKLKEIRDRLAAQSSEVLGTTPEEAARIFEADLVKNAKLVKQSGASLD